MQKSDWCPIYKGNATIDEETHIEYENPDYDQDECYVIRLPLLCYLTMEEADLCTRMLISVLLGGAIGYERRSADRPAGVRTMGLVSLGSCFFTISSQLAFKSSTMGWDASRVTAAIPSGCGFLGAGLIWKGQVREGENEKHEIHGLTTAAGVWLSAAIGVGCGGRMYFVSAYSMVLVTTILRYGPKIYLCFDYDELQKDSRSEEYQLRTDQTMLREDEKGSNKIDAQRRRKEYSVNDVHVEMNQAGESSQDMPEIRRRCRVRNECSFDCNEDVKKSSNDSLDDDLSQSDSSMELALLSSKQ